MSEFPGYPITGSSSWNPLLAARPALPESSYLGIPGIPGYPDREHIPDRPLYDPLQLATIQRSYAASPYSTVGYGPDDAAIARGYSTDLSHLRNYGLETRFGIPGGIPGGIPDRRSPLFRSPGSQLPPSVSPLTFEQIYHTREPSRVSPLSYNPGSKSRSAYGLEHHDPLRTEVAQTFEPFRASPRIEQGQVPAVRSRSVGLYPKANLKVNEVPRGKDSNKVTDSAKIWKPFDTFSPEKQGTSKRVENNNNVVDQDRNIPGFNLTKRNRDHESAAFMKYADIHATAKDTSIPSPKSNIQFPLKPIPVYEKPSSEICLEKNKLGNFQRQPDSSAVHSNESNIKSVTSPLELLQQLSDSKAGPYEGTSNDRNIFPDSSPSSHDHNSRSSFTSPIEEAKPFLPHSQKDQSITDNEQLQNALASLQKHSELNPSSSSSTGFQNLNLSALDKCPEFKEDHKHDRSNVHAPTSHYKIDEAGQTELPVSNDNAATSGINSTSAVFVGYTSATCKSEVDRNEVKHEPATFDKITNSVVDNKQFKGTIKAECKPTDYYPSADDSFSQLYTSPTAGAGNSGALINDGNITTIKTEHIKEPVTDHEVDTRTNESLVTSSSETDVKRDLKSNGELSLMKRNISALDDYYPSLNQNIVTSSGENIEHSAKEKISQHTFASAISVDHITSDSLKLHTNNSGENTFASVHVVEPAYAEKASDRSTNIIPNKNDGCGGSVNDNVNMMMKDADNSNLSTGSQYSESDSDTQVLKSKLNKMHTQNQGVTEASRGFAPANEKTRNVTSAASRQQVRSDGNRLPVGQFPDNHGLKGGDYNMCQNYNQNQPYSMNYPRTSSTFNENSQVLPNNHQLSRNDNPNIVPQQRTVPADGYGQYQRANINSPATQSWENTNASQARSVNDASEMSATPRVGESTGANVINAQLKTGSDDPVLPRFNSSPAEGFVPKSEPVFSQMEDSNDGVSNQHSSPANPFQVQEVEKEKDSELDQPFQWDYLHSKQFIDNVYSDQLGCEFSGVVKNEEEIRDTDSPKTFLDLDTIPKKSSMNTGSGLQRGIDPNRQQGMMGSYSSSHYSNQTAFNQRQNDSMLGRNQWGGQFKSEVGTEANQIKSEGQSHYSMQQKQSVNDGQNYHGNQYNQNYQSNYYQNQSGGQNMKNYQGNYSEHGRYDGNYYNQGMQPNTNSSNGHRYGNQAYPGQAYSAEYNSNKSPAHVSEEGVDETGKKKPKKRGRKRKCDKEVLDESKPHPNTIVMASANVGALIDPDRPECPVDNYGHSIETIFNYNVTDDLSPIAQQYLQIEQRICQRLLPFKYGWPTNVIYNPLVYAFQTHRVFVRRYCTSPRPIMFLGMNPGPYGMSQNGVPFGEVGVVRDWMKIKGNIYKPETEHPKKPVHGLGCTRCEVSGSRFWGLFQKICKVPENFFKNCFVYNFCPQAYMSESGKNITPPQLAAPELEQINEACDIGLVELVKLMNIHLIIGVGKFVQTRASKALHNAGITSVKVECILHPSPINPHANKGWEQIVAKQLIEMGVMHYLNTDTDDVQKSIGEWEQIAAQNAKVKFDEEQQEC